jgi:hypothetical protein
VLFLTRHALRVPLSAQLSRVQARAEEVRSAASEVERGVRDSAEDCCEALRAVEARALLALRAQADDLARALEAVQRCAEGAAAACAARNEPPLSFLERFRPLSDACERLTAKPLSQDIQARGRARARARAALLR